MKLLSIQPSTNPKKKLDAYFLIDNKKIKVVSFGNTNYSDFTIHKDKDRKDRYLKRHEKNENWSNPITSGSLSRWVLWEKPSLEQGIKYYKKRFSL